MKPFLSSALSFVLFFSTVGAGLARAAEDGKEKAGLNNPANEADGKAFAEAEALYAEAQYAEAEKAARALVGASTKVFGAEDRETLRGQSALLAAIGSQGRNAEAEEGLRSLVATATRVLGAEDKVTLLTRRRQAEGWYFHGKQKEAEADLRQRLPIYEAW